MPKSTKMFRRSLQKLGALFCEVSDEGASWRPFWHSFFAMKILHCILYGVIVGQWLMNVKRRLCACHGRRMVSTE